MTGLGPKAAQRVIKPAMATTAKVRRCDKAMRTSWTGCWFKEKSFSVERLMKKNKRPRLVARNFELEAS